MDHLDAELAAFEEELSKSAPKQEEPKSEPQSTPTHSSAPITIASSSAAPVSAEPERTSKSIEIASSSAEPVLGIPTWQTVDDTEPQSTLTSRVAPTGKKYVRKVGNEKWIDETLGDWPENDYRLFVGDLGNECTDEHLAAAFRKYDSFAKAKVVQDKKGSRPRGYGFVSFLDGDDYVRAFRDMNGKYVAGRPIKLKKSKWSDRTDKKKTKKLWKQEKRQRR